MKQPPQPGSAPPPGEPDGHHPPPAREPALWGARVASGDPAWVCGPVTPATDALLAWIVWQIDERHKQHERDGWRG